MIPTPRMIRFGVAALLIVAAAGTAFADERKFTYSYEAKTLPRGAWEFEQWATLETRREEGSFAQWRFREEVEYGLFDRLTAALYLNWEYEAISDVPGEEDEHEVEFETVSSEWKYKFSDGAADPIGALFYLELAAGGEEQEIELKLVLDKTWGAFKIAYNFVIEFEREEEEEADGEEEWERESALVHTLGISYQANPHFALGAEAYLKYEFEKNLDETEGHVAYAGPNVHVAFQEFWATLAVLRQVDGGGQDIDDEGHHQYEFRLVVGFNF